MLAFAAVAVAALAVLTLAAHAVGLLVHLRALRRRIPAGPSTRLAPLAQSDPDAAGALPPESTPGHAASAALASDPSAVRLRAASVVDPAQPLATAHPFDERTSMDLFSFPPIARASSTRPTARCCGSPAS